MIGVRSGAAPVRTMVVWCPDWPVVATIGAEGVSPERSIAVIEKGLVLACSAAARADGVKRGLRLREAQARSPQLLDFAYDPVRVDRAFEPMISALEEMSPNVQIVRAGSCALAVRGAARFYGGEHAAALAFLERFAELGVTDARVGVADGMFAADQAARLPGVDLIRIVPEGGSPGFLRGLPLQLLDEPELTTLLWRLGIRSLGDFAELPAADVRSRFGEPGARAHTRAAGLDGSQVVPRIPPEVRESLSDFEPPLDRIDQVAFGVRAAAERFIGDLAAARFVCTALRVELTSERGERRDRSWLHPRWFSAGDVVDRVRWQLQGGSTIESALSSPIARVRIVAEAVDHSARHETGLWGSGSEERIHHGLSRVQSIVGHEGVLTASIGGGRSPRERQILVPWGDRIEQKSTAPSSPKSRARGGRMPNRTAGVAGAGGARSEEQAPWPGSVPPPLPTTVFERPRAVLVLAAGQQEVAVTARGALTAEPALFSSEAGGRQLRPLEAWAGPWPVYERWWDSAARRRFDRFQVVDADGTAWLLALERGSWYAEARYD
ncbi:DNA polymerase Y family protein [Herbiconiux sp. CPCC 205763]|uniref:DNA polymerase Y family protein n=1 Tax=Herbiconiux aconitum TaxID=2970913 RepID=A0ABT2GTK2_9MICO|nr:DNA polymerase Y family protein [Herbiconiux aconitum]MCS5719466.1 DNA polymerase Y family protein [Herbiconiux aconitum]